MAGPGKIENFCALARAGRGGAGGRWGAGRGGSKSPKSAANPIKPLKMGSLGSAFGWLVFFNKMEGGGAGLRRPP
jgi:hypothetical protein